MMGDLSILEKSGKFIVAKNGKPIQLPKSDGQAIVTEFDSKQDAEKYMSILATLKKTKGY